MAVKTIDELAAANNIADTDVFIIDDGARNYKVAWSVLKRLIGSISNFTVDNTVGTITITLSTGASLTVTPHDPTKQDLLTFDSTPTAGSSKPVTSGGIKAALDDKLDAEDYAVFTGANASTAGSAGIVPAPAAGDTRFLSSSGAWTAPDSTPTAGSSNLPTSGGVKAALDGKQDELTFDTAPTAGSDNPVTSGGVFDAIQQSTACKYLSDVSKTVIQLLDGDYGNLTDGEFKEYRIRASDYTVLGFIVRHTPSYAAGILCTLNPGVVFHAVKRSASGSFELMQI